MTKREQEYPSMVAFLSKEHELTAPMKVEIRRNAGNDWFLDCYVGALVDAYTVLNRRRAQGWHVRISNSKTGFVISEH